MIMNVRSDQTDNDI